MLLFCTGEKPACISHAYTYSILVFLFSIFFPDHFASNYLFHTQYAVSSIPFSASFSLHPHKSPILPSGKDVLEHIQLAAQELLLGTCTPQSFHAISLFQDLVSPSSPPSCLLCTCQSLLLSSIFS